MTKRFLLSVLLVVFVVADADAQNRRHRRRGVILGGLAGAAVGAAIGDKGDNETAGALIGGAVGAVAGGAIGNQKDRRIEQQHIHAHQTHYYRQQLSQQQAQQRAQQQAAADWHAQQRAEQAVAMEDVVQMVRRGLGESTIIQHVRVNGVRHRLTVADIISLHEQNVSEPIINAMQSAPVYAFPEMTVYGPDGYPIMGEHPGMAPVQPYPYRGSSTATTRVEPSRGSSVLVPEPPVRPIDSSRPIDPTKPYLFPPSR